MFKLISYKNILPKSLFINGVTIHDSASNPNGMGRFGNVYRGEYRKQQVALTVLYKGKKSVSVLSYEVSLDDTDLLCKDALAKDFCREALGWRSLSHRFIIPLLGIFEEKSHLFLVSPFMTNETLTRWRENNLAPAPVEIHRLVRFQHLLEPSDGITLIC